MVRCAASDHPSGWKIACGAQFDREGPTRFSENMSDVDCPICQPWEPVLKDGDIQVTEL